MGEIDFVTTGRTDLTEYARERGLLTGSRLDHITEYENEGIDVRFIDMHWEDPDIEKLVSKCKRHKPDYAIAGDYSRDTDNTHLVNETADRLKNHCDNVIVVPKVESHLDNIPSYALVGYSTPSEYEGTDIGLRRYIDIDNDIHILGGTPHKQFEIIGKIWVDNVQSADSNSIHKAATMGSKYWKPDFPRWVKIDGDNAVERAYRRSVDNVIKSISIRGLF